MGRIVNRDDIASVAGVSESWLLANSFEDQAGLSEAIMVANERMNVTTQLVTVGAGTLSFSGGGITFTGFNLAPGHPNNNVLDTVSIGGGGFAVPVLIEQAVPDDSYSVAMTATTRTHGGSMTDPESNSGSPSATTSATAVFGPTPGGAPAVPFTTFFYSASVTVSKNGGPAQSLFSGSFNLDSAGNLSTTGDIASGDLTPTASGFSFAAPIEFSTALSDPVDSFVFNFQSTGDLLTVAVGVPEPGSITLLLVGLAGLGCLGWIRTPLGPVAA